MTRLGTTPALNAATPPNTSGRRCAAPIAQAAPLENPAAIQRRPPSAGSDSAAHGMTSPVTNERCAANRRGECRGTYSSARRSGRSARFTALCTPTSSTGGAVPAAMAGSSARAKADTDCPSATRHPGSGSPASGGMYTVMSRGSRSAAESIVCERSSPASGISAAGSAGARGPRQVTASGHGRPNGRSAAPSPITTTVITASSSRRTRSEASHSPGAPSTGHSGTCTPPPSTTCSASPRHSTCSTSSSAHSACVESPSRARSPAGSRGHQTRSTS